MIYIIYGHGSLSVINKCDYKIGEYMYPYFTLFGKNFSSYGVMAILGGIGAAIYATVRTRQKKLNGNDVLFYLTFAFGFLVIGAMLLFQIVELDNLIRIFPYLFKDIKYFLSHWNVGLVFYGGLYGALLGGMFYTRTFKQDTREMFMYLTPIIPLFHMFGRIGCFLGGCCYGIENEQFGIAYTNSPSGANGVPYLPVQLYEAFGELVIFIVLCFHQRKVKKYYQPVGIYLTFYGVMRFTLEFLRGDEVRGIFGMFSTSQWISLVTIPLGIYCLVVPPEKNFLNRLYTPKKPKSNNPE